MADVMTVTSGLLDSAKARKDRELAVEASAFLPISVDGALALLKRGDTVERLRRRIEKHLAGEAAERESAPLPPHPGVRGEDGPGSTPEQRANAAADRKWEAELDAGVLEHRRTQALKHARRSAVFSDCGRYRYRLDRVWGSAAEGRVVWVMLNPSTADGSDDDATLKRILVYSATWGYGALTVVNLFAYKATYTTELARELESEHVVDPDADRHIDEALAGADLAICGWGNSVNGPVVQARIDTILARILRAAGLEPHALAVTADGQPRHPVRLRADLVPRPLAEFAAENRG
jgi:hypothetical protein